MQTKIGSLIEAGTNVLIGFGVAVCSQMIVFPLLGIYVSVGTNLTIGVIFTGISLVRSYLLRRIFTHYNLFRTRR